MNAHDCTAHEPVLGQEVATYFLTPQLWLVEARLTCPCGAVRHERFQIQVPT